MKTTITLLSTLLLSILSQAQEQTFSWIKTPEIDLTLNPDMVGYVNTIDSSGNIYMAGFMSNATPCSPEIMGNLFYNKYDNDGEIVFTKTFNGTGAIFDLQSDTEGNTLVVLGFQDNITLNNTTLTADVPFQTKLVLVKLDSSGNLQWYYEPVMENAEEWDIVTDFRSVTTDSNNNIYIAYDNFNNSFITKISPEGDDLLTITQTSVNRITSVSTDKNGNIYAAGSCPMVNAQFAGVSVSPGEGFNYNTYVVKYNSNGEYQWVKYVEDITCPEPQVVAYSPDEIYFSSYLFGNFMFDDITTQGGNTFGDFFLAKLNSNGVYQWVREIPGLEGNAELGKRKFLNVDDTGNIYLGGKTRWETDWGNGTITNTEGFSSDALVLKYNPEGDLMLVKTITGAGESRVDNIMVSQSGDIFIAGMGNGTTNFDNIIYEADDFENFSYLAKMIPGSLGMDENYTSALAVYPNPASDYLHINGLRENVEVTIYNTLGQQVKSFELKPDENINIQDLSKGTYLIKPTCYSSLKFIKN